MAKHHLSRAAIDRLGAELYDLTTRGRIEIAKKIEAARLLGDLSENGDYHAAKDEQGHLEGRIRQLEYLLDPENLDDQVYAPGLVAPGLVVTILYDGDDEDMAERYLVGHPEEQTEGIEVMSPQSPLGTALLGKAEGDIVTYKVKPEDVHELSVRILGVEAAG